MAPGRPEDIEDDQERLLEAEQPLLEGDDERGKGSSTLLTVCPFILGENSPVLQNIDNHKFALRKIRLTANIKQDSACLSFEARVVLAKHPHLLSLN